MSAAAPAVRILPRAACGSRPASDPDCAGCRLMGLLRALRRSGLEVQGGPGCDPAAPRAFAEAPGRWAAVCGVREVLGADAVAPPGDRPARVDAAAVERALRAGARLLAVADRRRPGAFDGAVAGALAAAGMRVLRLDPSDLAAAEAAIAGAAEERARPVAVVALVPCVRGAPRARPLAVEPARCNRCGSCIALGCPAISDEGGEAMVIDPAVCTGCAVCAGLCRSRGIAGAADSSGHRRSPAAPRIGKDVPGQFPMSL